MEICLQGMPYEILYEIFHELPKVKLDEISELCSKFRDVAQDTRLWKYVHIKYKSFNETLDFEDLYSEPWPVKVIDLDGMTINPPVSSDFGQVVKVVTLNLEYIEAEKVTMEAILTKYQCTELNLGYARFSVAPEVFLKQTALEVLSLEGIFADWPEEMNPSLIQPQGLGPLLSNCKHLKTLNLSQNGCLTDVHMLSFIKSLPASLEKLSLKYLNLTDLFLNSLAESTPNLKDLELDVQSVECPSLLQFECLENLRFNIGCYLGCYGVYSPRQKENLHRYLIKFPALKTVYLCYYICLSDPQTYEELEKCRKELEARLELCGICVKLMPIDDNFSHLWDTINLWKVTKVGCWTKSEYEVHPYKNKSEYEIENENESEDESEDERQRRLELELEFV